jgi:hypothetical protein
MTPLAPAIVDVRRSGAEPAGGLAQWLCGIGVRQVRLACGPVMFSYVFSHFYNHSLGNISYAFQMAEVAIPRQMFQEILRLIAELRPQPPLAPA